MHKVKFKPTDALKEHLLSGGEVSILEAYVVFGVQNINAELGRLKKTGFIVQTSTSAYGKNNPTDKRSSAQ